MSLSKLLYIKSIVDSYCFLSKNASLLTLINVYILLKHDNNTLAIKHGGGCCSNKKRKFLALGFKKNKNF